MTKCSIHCHLDYDRDKQFVIFGGSRETSLHMSPNGIWSGSCIDSSGVYNMDHDRASMAAKAYKCDTVEINDDSLQYTVDTLDIPSNVFDYIHGYSNERPNDFYESNF